MAKKPVVKIFYPKKYVTLTTDASEHSISGILSQERTSNNIFIKKTNEY